MRDNSWLESKLEAIWKQYFSDVERINPVRISFGRSARTRLGSIKMKKEKESPSIITITGHFKDLRVPEFMIDGTIAHELCHYAHGFSSPHPQLQRYPHQGGIVDKELIKRGLGDILIEQNKWLKANWLQIAGKNRRRRSRRRPYRLFKLLDLRSF